MSAIFGLGGTRPAKWWDIDSAASAEDSAGAIAGATATGAAAGAVPKDNCGAGTHGNPPSADSCTSPKCPPPPEKPPVGEILRTTRKKDCARRAGNACCKQVAEALRRQPGFPQSLLHKPKTTPQRKLSCLCGALPTSDAIIPMLFQLLERARRNTAPANSFEAQVFNAIKKIPENHLTVLNQVLMVFNKMPVHLKHCVFKEQYLALDSGTAVEPGLFLDELLREGVVFVTDTLYPRSGGILGPGRVRMWERVFPPLIDGHEERKVTAPWPWISAVRPLADGKEYRNNTYRPKLSGVKQHEYARLCSYTLNKDKPSAPPIGECVVTRPAIGEFCDGGPDYTVSDGSGRACLRIPETAVGATVGLRGFNFISEKCKIRLHNTEDARTVFTEVDCRTIGDFDTPVLGTGGEVIVDGRVEDWIEFDVPLDKPSRPFPTGRYEVVVAVPNITNSVVDGTIPEVLLSNTMTLQINPDPTTIFRIFSNYGYCDEPTDGEWGNDEIWLDAYVGMFDPAVMTAEGPVPSVVDMPFDRGAWSDIEQGAPGYTPPVDFLNARFPLGGVLAVGLVGLEVDSEAAAKEQLKSFGDAFLYYLKQVWSAAIAAEGIVGSLAKIASLTLGHTALALAITGIVILLIGIAFSIWAPADPIAYDVFWVNAATAFELTNAKTPLGPPTKKWISDVWITTTPVEKRPLPLSEAAMFTEIHLYDAGEQESFYQVGVSYQRG